MSVTLVAGARLTNLHCPDQVAQRVDEPQRLVRIIGLVHGQDQSLASVCPPGRDHDAAAVRRRRRLRGVTASETGGAQPPSRQRS